MWNCVFRDLENNILVLMVGVFSIKKAAICLMYLCLYSEPPSNFPNTMCIICTHSIIRMHTNQNVVSVQFCALQNRNQRPKTVAFTHARTFHLFRIMKCAWNNLPKSLCHMLTHFQFQLNAQINWNIEIQLFESVCVCFFFGPVSCEQAGGRTLKGLHIILFKSNQIKCFHILPRARHTFAMPIIVIIIELSYPHYKIKWREEQISKKMATLNQLNDGY